jgi:hypothetical protein
MLEDEDIMPWKPHRGKRLDEVPASYWQWCLRQPWFTKEDHEDLYRYAVTHSQPPKSYEEVVREFLRGPKPRRRPSRPNDEDDGDYGIGISDPFANA